MNPHTAVLIGSNDLLWASLRVALQSMPETRVLADLGDARLAVPRVRALRPDGLLMESAPGGAPAAPLVREIRAVSPTTKILLFATTVVREELLALAGVGVDGYLLWRDIDFASLQHYLGAVLDGNVVLASRSMPAGALSTGEVHLQLGEAPLTLSEREQAVLRGLADGRTQKEIAAADHLSVRTVKRIVATLEQKLDAHSPFALGARACALGLI